MIPQFSQPYDPHRLGGDAPVQSGFMGFRSDVEREFPLPQQHAVDSPDVRTVLAMGEEVINISGALLELHHRTDNQPDEVFDEDPDPTYWPPIFIKGMFPPGAVELLLKLWGSDAPVKLEIYFSVKALSDKCGERSVRGGDVLLVPFNAVGNIKPKYFRVLNVTPVGNHMYAWIYAKCNCESLTGDITVVPRDGNHDAPQ